MGPGALSLLGGHEIVLPIVLPLVAGALILLLESARSHWVPAFSLGATLLGALLAAALVAQASQGEVQAYLLGNWRAPWGIALALDRLAALMLTLTSAVALAALAYALGSERTAASATSPVGSHFHSLFQFQLMGLNGAFLTADLFNLFVFFEVLLAASYGLLLHDATRERLRAAVHYVVFNLAGSALFLVALGLLYGVAGTLNMADLAQKLAQLPATDVRLAQAAALLLLVVFAVKAALLPLYFWLPETYASAAAPVAALFAIMTKVGVYAIARTTTLTFGGGALAGLAQPALPILAMATLVLAAQGALAATRLRTLAAYLVVASAGTLLLAVGLGGADALAAGLVYLVNSTLAAALWFLLADRIGAARAGSDRLEAAAWLRASWAPLGIGFFLAAVAAAGLPPLAGFFGKAMLLRAALPTPLAPWVMLLVLGSSLALLVALARAGSTLFWKPAAGPAAASVRGPGASPALALGPAGRHAASPAQRWALVGLATAVLATAAGAGPLAAYAAATAAQLTERRGYIEAVLGAQPAPPAPPAHDVRREMRERGELE
ncbi:MAG: monovalent cation/H+ antiporter subunit D [Burkholderiaceae bacterium]|nr:monovalent cation/H+ antiporter subunit D [Burkholderiaceae bacterium]